VTNHTLIEGSYIYDHKIGPKRTVTISVAGEPLSDEAWVTFWDDARKAGLKKEQITLRQNTRSMTKDQILLMIHDLHGETDLALREKDEKIGALSRQLDSLNRQQDSLNVTLKKLLEAQALMPAADSAKAADTQMTKQP
jgi:hypothetical protein